MTRDRFSQAAWFIVPVVLGCGGRAASDADLPRGHGGAAASASSGGRMAMGGTSSGGRMAMGGTTATTTTTAPAAGGSAGTSATGCDGCACPDLWLDPGFGQSSLCGSLKVTDDARISNLLFLVDNSGSMNTVPVAYTKSKRAALIDALKVVLWSDQQEINYGLQLFPSSGNSTAAVCEVNETGAVDVAVSAASNSLPRIDSWMAQTVPFGGTPTAAALRNALAYYTLGAGAQLVGNRYVVLITDGGPNCNDSLYCAPERCTANLDRTGSCGVGVPNCCDMSLAVQGRPSPAALCLDDVASIAAMGALASAGVKTFVVGLPGSEPYAEVLSQMALMGGAPLLDQTHQYYRVSEESELSTNLTAITTTLMRRCDVPLSAAPLDINLTNLALDCEPIPQMVGSQVNWIYEPNTQSIVLQGSLCEKAKTSGFGRVDVVQACQLLPF